VAYTDAQKAIAVEIVRRSDPGGSISNAALAEIRKKLSAPKLPYQTIRNWVSSADFKNISTIKKDGFEIQIPVEQKAQETLDNMFEDVARLYLERAKDETKIADSSAKDLVTSAAIAIDKMRLLRNLPTEIVAILPDLVEIIRRKGGDPLSTLASLKSKFDALPDAPMLTENHGSN
jgi:hypothetical protein